MYYTFIICIKTSTEQWRSLVWSCRYGWRQWRWRRWTALWEWPLRTGQGGRTSEGHSRLEVVERMFCFGLEEFEEVQRADSPMWWHESSWFERRKCRGNGWMEADDWLWREQPKGEKEDGWSCFTCLLVKLTSLANTVSFFLFVISFINIILNLCTWRFPLLLLPPPLQKWFIWWIKALTEHLKFNFFLLRT